MRTLLGAVSVLLIALGPTASAPVAAASGSEPVPVEVFLPGVERVELAPSAEGRFVYRVHTKDGRDLAFGPAEFSAWVHERASRRPLWLRVLNISSPIGVAWVALGLLGQLAFTGRMLVQWLTSERHGRSVVPVAFWWMSIGGAAMLLVYFVWRKDVVGILGQSAGFFIYARNLWLLHHGRTPAVAD